ncbi:MAG: hypothetical protein JXB46_01370 [Candidatus Eisenbacteria bacterium]|nr:hypothetical protein [Candidatus Eisenbacteria bacterium]
MAMQDEFETVTAVPTTVELPLYTDDKGVLRVQVCNANPGDTIRWKTDGRTVSVWFPTQGVFSAPALANRAKGEVDVVIPRTATPGTYQYCIYCHDTDQFVECQSHPKLVIPVPN